MQKHQKYSCLLVLFKQNHNKYMTILFWYRGFEVIVFSIGDIDKIYSIVNPKELKISVLCSSCVRFGDQGISRRADM